MVKEGGTPVAADGLKMELPGAVADGGGEHERKEGRGEKEGEGHMRRGGGRGHARKRRGKETRNERRDRLTGICYTGKS